MKIISTYLFKFCNQKVDKYQIFLLIETSFVMLFVFL